MKPKLSIIIVSYNSCEITIQCIKSIYSSEWRDDYEIIVVDNNSKDDSVKSIRKNFPEVKIIENKENKYFAIANNQGAEISNGKYLLLLNSDTIVEKDNLQKMVDYFDTLPSDVICIGPKILNADGSIQSKGMPLWSKKLHHYASLYCIDKLLPLYLISEPLDRRADSTHRTGWVAGCCMMIPRDKYKEVGGLNEKLVFYGEEPEFGYRTEKLGYKTIYYSDAYITHLGGVSSKNEFSKLNDEDRFLTDMKQYESLVSLTVGYKAAIKTSRRTRTSLRIKRLFYKNKKEISAMILHETKSIDYFKRKLANN